MSIAEIPLPRHFDRAWMLDFLGARAVPGLECVAGGAYRRSLRLSGRAITFDVRLGGQSSARTVRVRTSGTVSDECIRRTVTQMLDLDSDLRGFLRVAKADTHLRTLVQRRPGIRLPRYVDPFECLVRAILGQLVSVAAARTITARLVANFGEPAPALNGETLRLFPGAEGLAGVSPAALRAIGLPRAKTKAIQYAARAVANGELDFAALEHDTAEDADAALRALPGVGPWTAAYVRMRALGDADAFPATDLGVVRALERLGLNGAARNRRAIERLAEAWRPWRAYATLHLWNSLSEKPRP